MIILGIDPGLQFSGFGILKKEKQKTYLLENGLLKLKPKNSIPSRLLIFHDFFSEKIKKYGVTDIAIETPFLGKNAQVFLKLGYLRGILFFLSSKYNLSIHEFSPRQVKSSITGFGGASKKQVASVIFKLFPKMNHHKKDDVTDALAVTLCGLWNKKKSYFL